jgi:hypothetical protein
VLFHLHVYSYYSFEYWRVFLSRGIAPSNFSTAIVAKNDGVICACGSTCGVSGDVIGEAPQ